jgi:dihydroxyacetone kinase-like protein
LLKAIAWGVMGAAGGAPGPLLGSLFLGLAEGLPEGPSLDCPAVAAMFEAGLAKLRKQTKAQRGDKTMLDALVPAVEALRSSAESGAGVGAAMKRAAGAARGGAESTKDMLAKFGKARNMGERTLGHVDPGAMSVTYIFEGFAEALADGEG